MTIWASESTLCMLYLLLTVQILSFARCVCARMCERGRHGHITTAACLQTQTSFITVSVMRLCSTLTLELMVKLRTLLTIFTFILKTEARDYGKCRNALCSRAAANDCFYCRLIYRLFFN